MPGPWCASVRTGTPPTTTAGAFRPRPSSPAARWTTNAQIRQLVSMPSAGTLAHAEPTPSVTSSTTDPSVHVYQVNLNGISKFQVKAKHAKDNENV